MYWGYLLHLSYNMWNDTEGPGTGDFHPDLRVDRGLWDEIVSRLVDAGASSVLIDLGDGVRWDSHPEIAVRGAWTPDQLGEELERLRSVGLEPLPKLNFSACHDAWLHEYSRQVSTPVYYEVARDLIDEAATLFGRPSMFHLGLDEETYGNQRRLSYVVVRQNDLWWEDADFLFRTTREAGCRPWVWSDQMWHDTTYVHRMPKDVMQSNWHYHRSFEVDRSGERPRAAIGRNGLGEVIRDERPLSFVDLDDHGFDQIPTGSNYNEPDNFELLAQFAREELDPARVKGFLQTAWRPTQNEFTDRHVAAIDQLALVRRRVEG